MTYKSDRIQQQWKKHKLPGLDCICFGNGDVVLANAYCTQDLHADRTDYHWIPMCDTTVQSIERYDEIWVETDVINGSLKHGSETFFYGDGAKGSEGYVASAGDDGWLNWAIFFTFSNPISRVEVENELLKCYADGGLEINVSLNELTRIDIRTQH